MLVRSACLGLLAIQVCFSISARANAEDGGHILVDTGIDLSRHLLDRLQGLRTAAAGDAVDTFASPELASVVAKLDTGEDVEVVLTIDNRTSFRHVSGLPHKLSGKIENGFLVRRSINGLPATLRELDALNTDFRRRLRSDQRDRVAANSLVWAGIAHEIRNENRALAKKILAADRSASSTRTISLNLAEIELLATRTKERSLRLAPVRRVVDSVTITSAVATLGFCASPGATPNGAGVGVWQSEGGNPEFLPNVDLDRYDNMDPSGVDTPHATRTTTVLQQAALGAHVFWAKPGSGNCGPRNDVLNWGDDVTRSPPPVFLATHSFVDDTASIEYSNCAKDYDNFVLHTRVSVFKGAGNEINGVVKGGSMARNILTVGSANTTGVDASADCGLPLGTFPAQGIHCGSAHGDWRVGGLFPVPKPEIVAPGASIEIPNIAAGSGNLYVASGTSMATPLAAALGAAVVQAYPDFEGRPHLLKAALLASAESWDTDTSSTVTALDGAGMPSFAPLSDLNAEYSAFEATNVVDHIGRSPYFVAGETYRLALVWLNDGDYARNNIGKVSSRWELEVIAPPGAPMGPVEYRRERGFQLMEYTAPLSGTYQVNGNRVLNNDPEVPTVVALVILD